VAEGGTYSTDARMADVADARAAVSVAQSNVKLSQGNLTSNAVREQDVQQARDAIDQASAQIKVNQSQVNKTVIRTPISGTVLQLAAQQGETLAAGLSAPTLIIVADLKRLEVDAYVDETDIGKVKLGQPVDITVDAFPDLTIRGKVSKVASGSTIQQGVVTYGVTIYIEDTSHALKPDMTANISIETGRRTDVLIVPTVAVQVGVSQSTVGVLSKKDGQTSIKTTKVVTGGTDGINIEILSGLKEGDAIVLAGGNAKSQAAASSSPFSSGNGGGRPGGGGGGGGGRPGG
jgi:RND family efflux transporter MFP subunit